MTQSEAMHLYDRVLSLGYFVPPDPENRPNGVFYEWFTGLERYTADDVDAGITALKRTKADNKWPTLGEWRGAIGAATSGRESSRKCPECHGSTWVAARPYRANAGHVYEGVVRCPVCGVPEPKDTSGAYQTPLTDREFAEWQKAQRPLRVITSRDEMFARIRAVTGTRVVPAISVEESWPV
jgi:hypothetical protein